MEFLLIYEFINHLPDCSVLFEHCLASVQFSFDQTGNARCEILLLSTTQQRLDDNRRAGSAVGLLGNSGLLS